MKSFVLAMGIAAVVGFNPALAQTSGSSEPAMHCGAKRHVEVTLDIDRATAGNPLEVVARACVAGVNGSMYKIRGLDIEFSSFGEASRMFEAFKTVDWEYPNPEKVRKMMDFVWKIRDRKVADANTK